MSDLTAELNLALCVDNDDTADYLTTVGGLRGSLNTIDGLFSSSTGHNHNGAHQGGNFTALTLTGLTVNGNASITGTLTVTGASHLATLLVDSTLTAGASTLSSLNVSGATTLSGSLSVTNMTSSGYVAAGPVSTGAGAGDLSANRQNNTAYVFLATSAHYLGFDGTAYVLPAADLNVNGSRVVTENNTSTLANKTLTAPTINGAVGGTPGLPASTTVGGDPALRGYSGHTKVITGLCNSGSLANNNAAPIAVSFGYTFSTTPDVLVSLADASNRAYTDVVGICRYNVTTTGMTVEFLNRSGGTQTFFAQWLAIGGA